MKTTLARLAVKYLMSEIREALGYPDPKRYTVKGYVHYLADIIADWNNKDAAFYLSEWLEDYLEDYLEKEQR